MYRSVIRDQKRMLDTLELELQLLATMWVLRIKLDLELEHPVLLTAEPSL